MVPGLPFSRRPMAVPGAPAPSGAATSRPPEVIASQSSQRRGSGTPSAQSTAGSTQSRLRLLPPAIGGSSASKRASTSGNAGTSVARTTADTALALASSWRWPRRPYPVTSVTALASAWRASRAASRLSAVMTSIDDAGDGEAVLGLGVVDRVAADDGHAGVVGNVGAAAQYLAQRIAAQVDERPGHQVQRGERRTAHR